MITKRIFTFMTTRLRSSKIAYKVNTQRRGSNFIIKLMRSYLLIILIWIMIIFLVGSYFISKLMLDDSVNNNNKSLLQFSTMADDYIMKNMKDLSVRLYEDCQTQSFLYSMMVDPLENQVVDTLKIKDYLGTMLTLNPVLESLAIYYPKNDLLVTNYVILYPGKENMYMGSLLANFRNLSQFDSAFTWLPDPGFQVNPSQASIQQSDRIEAETIQAIHFARKIPSVDDASQTGGILFVTLREDYLFEMLQPTGNQKYDKLIMMDSQGVIAAHTDAAMINEPVTRLSFGRYLLDAPVGSSDQIVKQDGTRLVVSLYRSELTQWVYSSVTSLGRLSSMGLLILQMLGLTIIIASIIALVLASYYARKMYLPLGKLVYTCIRLSPQLRIEGANEYQLINSTLDTLQIEMKQQQQIREKSQGVLKHDYMRDLFENERQPSMPIAEWLKSLGISFIHQAGCAFILKVRRYVGKETDSLATLTEAYASNLEAMLNTEWSACLTNIYEDSILLIVNFDQNQLGLANLIDKIVSQDGQGEIISVSIFCGDVVALENLHTSANRSQLAAAYHFLLPELNCIRYDDISVREDSKTLIDRNQQKELALQLKTLNRSKAMAALDNLVSSLRNSTCSLDHARWIMHITANVVGEIIGYDVLSQDYQTDNVMDRLESSEDIFKYKNILAKEMDGYFQNIEEQHSERNLSLVNKAKAYMQQNINSSQLSLNDVADYIGISPSHFSRIFKKETGMSFLDFVTDYKLEYCRKLLVTTDTKIEQISNMLGYSTPQYFANRFKIKYGCTPKDYRFRAKE